MKKNSISKTLDHHSPKNLHSFLLSSLSHRFNSKRHRFPTNIYPLQNSYIRPNACTRDSAVPDSACTCTRTFLARACIMHEGPAEEYISAVRRAEMYSPNYLRIGVLNSSPTAVARLPPPTRACARERFGSADCFIPLHSANSTFTMVDGAFAWNAFIWNRPFFQRLLEKARVSLATGAYILVSEVRVRARDISRRGHSRDVRKVARRKLVPVMTTYLPAARRSLLRDIPRLLPVRGRSRIRFFPCATKFWNLRLVERFAWIAFLWRWYVSWIKFDLAPCVTYLLTSV